MLEYQSADERNNRVLNALRASVADDASFVASPLISLAEFDIGLANKAVNDESALVLVRQLRALHVNSALLTHVGHVLAMRPLLVATFGKRIYDSEASLPVMEALQALMVRRSVGIDEVCEFRRRWALFTHSWRALQPLVDELDTQAHQGGRRAMFAVNNCDEVKMPGLCVCGSERVFFSPSSLSSMSSGSD